MKLRAGGRSQHGLQRQNANKLSPDKSMMPLRNNLEIFPEYLVPKRKLRSNFDCVIRGPPRVVCGEILVTVPWPTSPQKNSEILTNIVDFSGYRKAGKFKKIEWVRAGPPYKWAKVQPDRLNGEIFLAKKPKSPLPPMVNRKTLERSREQSTPPHSLPVSKKATAR